jgi:hypothetical protein
MQENLATGAERVHSQIYQIEAVVVVNRSEDLGLILAESARSDFQRVMVRFAISRIGSAKVPYHHYLNRSVVHGKEVGRERMTVPRNSETVDRPRLHGVKVVLKVVHKKTVRDRQDVSSRNDPLLSGFPRQPSRIASGVSR